RLRGEVALDLRPALGGLDGVVALGAGALDPAPALAHLVPHARAALAGRAERLERGLLADLPLRALHELEDPDRPAGAPRAQRHAERGRRLALAEPGGHRQHVLPAPLARGEPVVGHALDLALRHLQTPSALRGTQVAES